MIGLILPNEVLWLVLMAGCFAGITAAYAIFGRAGLFAWIAMAVIVANIQVLKIVEIFGFRTAMGNILYGTTFLVTDILAEVHGERDAKRAVHLGFFVLLAVAAIMQLSLAFVPSDAASAESLGLSENLTAVFRFFPRITFASLAAYILSQSFDVWFFQALRRRTRGQHLWLRNNLSTLVSQLLDNVIFTWIAFVGFGGVLGFDRVEDWSTIASIFLTAYALKVVVAGCDTPFVYLARRIRARRAP